MPTPTNPSNSGYIEVDLNARSDDGRQKQVGFHWFAGNPDDQTIKTSKGHWFIDLDAFDLLVKWCQEKYPSLDYAEREIELENAQARLKSETQRHSEHVARLTAEAATELRATKAVYDRIIDKLLPTPRERDYDDD